MQQEHSTQQSLGDAIAEAGFVVNQGTVSRELKRIGVRKVGGVYRLGKNETWCPDSLGFGDTYWNHGSVKNATCVCFRPCTPD